MNHPAVERTLRTGYPAMNYRTNEYCVDMFGETVCTGDEILVFQDSFFLAGALTEREKEILELLGATYEEAQ
ncbi:hypothetical protein JUJ52_08660 [Virgibacillus sp. AGTR]|uniref:hypothetical protein n=1 Tax=Virgibacillus sp. AGTR TaxID=2812055 RepID=UPI00196461E6|nr:hypothetical protein [Virgibacillus sp. AGTR]MCC2250036.1 hypothetical protein [Virgibacillus sp. AGTR]QRZ17787.1 hypothetical protein JUJ52_18925 [Virgibacillus sp. AGTR]